MDKMSTMIDLFELINEWSLSDQNKQVLVKSVFETDSIFKCYALGINEHSKTLSKEIHLAGFIDDFTSADMCEGLKIYKMQEVVNEPNTIIINCVLCTKPKTAWLKLLDMGANNTLNLTDLLKAKTEKITQPNFVKDMQHDFIKNHANWENLYEKLADETSKKTLNDLISYRLTADIKYVSSYDFRPQSQYFEDFMTYSNEVFVDAGGYDGDTTEEFCKTYTDYKKVFLIEPSLNNMQKAKLRLKSYKNIHYIEKGVSDKNEQLRFASSSGSASIVSNSGDVIIDVEPIDSLIKEPVTFIKMDLEGWEINALKGAKHHIVKDHPKLAIAVYHQADHFWRIYNYVINLRCDYKVFLRHYTEGWSETVMYFLPIK
jgi:FkbM family methyltransferase